MKAIAWCLPIVAIDRVDANKPAEAIQNFQYAIMTNPHFPKAYNNMACAMVLSGYYGQPQNVQLVHEGLRIMEQAIITNI